MEPEPDPRPEGTPTGPRPSATGQSGRRNSSEVTADEEHDGSTMGGGRVSSKLDGRNRFRRGRGLTSVAERAARSDHRTSTLSR